MIDPHSQSPLRLMNAVAKGDASAQTALLERLTGRVHRLCRKLCASPNDVEDATQQVLIEILKSAQSFELDGSLERWADRITARTVLRTNKLERQRARLLARWLPPGHLPWGTSLQTPHQGSTDVRALLMRLSKRRREVFILRYAFGYRVNEIVEMTGAPHGTVKDRLVNARKQLRDTLARGAPTAPRVARRAYQNVESGIT